MARRISTKGEYYDLLTRGGRRCHGNNHQVRDKVKRRYRRRERRVGKRLLHTEGICF